MKFTKFALVIAALSLANSAQARIVRRDSPLASLMTSRSSSVEEDVPVPRDAVKSARMGRVTRHIRPDYSDPIARRQSRPSKPYKRSQEDYPQPIRGSKGAGAFLTSNRVIDGQNPDYIAPPSSDHGVVPNLKWSFSLSQTQLQEGGWLREQTSTDLPSSTFMSGVEQRLTPFASRVLHWHSVNEWGYVINGTLRITANDENGQNWVSDAVAGDIWAFPYGVPHSLQAGPEGCEYIAIFDQGDFDATGTTFQIDDWIQHTPRDVLAENFGVNASVFDNVPKGDPLMVSGDSWSSIEEARKVVTGNPSGEVKNPFHYELSKVEEKEAAGGGGWTKITDKRQFPQSPTIASALVNLTEPYSLRELHWHKNSEWGYVLSGKGRATAFSGGSNARTFDLQAGDSWVFPYGYGHYIQNVGPEPLVFLELFRGPNFNDPINFNDFSLRQWLALTPPDLAAHQLNVSIDVIKNIPKTEQLIVKKPANITY